MARDHPDGPDTAGARVHVLVACVLGVVQVAGRHFALEAGALGLDIPAPGQSGALLPGLGRRLAQQAGHRLLVAQRRAAAHGPAAAPE